MPFSQGERLALVLCTVEKRDMEWETGPHSMVRGRGGRRGQCGDKGECRVMVNYVCGTLLW